MLASLFWLLAFFFAFVCLLCLGALIARRDLERDFPMARRVKRDVLPPPSPNCERRGSVVEFRRANG